MSVEAASPRGVGEAISSLHHVSNNLCRSYRGVYKYIVLCVAARRPRQVAPRTDDDSTTAKARSPPLRSRPY
jgi:hypothetical protein